MSYIRTKTSYITVQGNRIAYRELGNGKSNVPLVMLVHLAATLDNWDPKLIDLLAKQQHVILLDLPGVGASSGKVATTIPGMAHQAIGIIEALGYDKVNLLGGSRGSGHAAGGSGANRRFDQGHRRRRSVGRIPAPWTTALRNLSQIDGDARAPTNCRSLGVVVTALRRVGIWRQMLPQTIVLARTLIV